MYSSDEEYDDDDLYDIDESSYTDLEFVIDLRDDLEDIFPYLFKNMNIQKFTELFDNPPSFTKHTKEIVPSEFNTFKKEYCKELYISFDKLKNYCDINFTGWTVFCYLNLV